jgi:hypothetical protein
MDFDYRFHVGGLAMTDTVLTALFAIWLSYRYKWSTPLTILVVFLIGIAVHRMIDERTFMDRFLFNT